jgi:hypothetical protein
MSEEDDKKQFAAVLEQFGDHHQAFMVQGIQKMLHTITNSADQIATHYANDPWAREWVDLVKRAVADLRAAEAAVKIQPLAPHGEVPS